MRTLTAVLLLALAANLVACGGGTRSTPGSAPDAEETRPATAATPPPTPSVTPTLPTPTPSPTPLPFNAIPLRPAPAQELPTGIVLYYFGRRVPIEGIPDTLLRAYRLESGVVVEDVLRNLPVKGVPWGWAIDAPRQRIAVAICLQGDCSVHTGVAVRATRDVVYLTEDGGSTWRDLGQVEPYGARPFGFVNDQIALYPLPDADRSATDERGRVVLFPSGEEFIGPYQTSPIIVEDRKLAWSGENGALLSTEGVPLRIVPDVLKSLRVYRTGFGAEAMLDVVYASPERTTIGYLFEFDPTNGTIGRAVTWTDNGPLALARLSDDLLVTLMFPLPSEGFRVGTATLDLRTGEYRTISGLRRPGLDRDVYPIDVDLGGFVRVKGTGSCLNVRAMPLVTSPSLGCYEDGTLLGHPSGYDGVPEGWLVVFTPDGRQGYAVAEFLER